MDLTPADPVSELAPGTGSLRLVRLRLSLALMAMAILPLAIVAPLAATALDGQRSAERLRIERDATAVAATLGTTLDQIGQELVRAADEPAVRGTIAGARGSSATARLVLGDLTAETAIQVATVVDEHGRPVLRIVAGKVVPAASSSTVDPVVASALLASHDEVTTGDIRQTAAGTALVGLAVPVFGDGDALLGAVHVDVSLTSVLARSISSLGGSESASLLDRGGTPVATAPAPGADASGSAGGAAGGAVLSTETIAGRDWRIAVAAPSALAGPSLTLIALLALGVVVIAWFIVLMARQVLRPAEELDASRARLHDLWELAKVDSLRDLLTGLGNHRAFQEELDRQVDTARRYGAPLAVATLDLDDFQAVNDEIGHAQGDEVLAAFGQLIGHTLRFADRAFRTGGDEFALLLPHTDPAGAETLLRRLLSNALEPPRGRELSRAVSFSAGISSVPALAGDKRQLIGQAEAALAGAKRAGRMAIEVYDPARHRGAGVPLDLGALSASVAETVARRLLRPVYQPIVDLRSGKVVGYEGLIRPLPGSGFTNTGALFEAAARTGRTVELDHACLEIVAVGARELGRDGWLTMNVSPRTLEVPDFSPAALLRVVAAAGLEPARIVLELTERETVEEVERLRRNVAACRESGFRVAADDVGSGNAGLRLLSQLQFDIVKIDLSLVQEGALHETSLAVVGSLQELARRWGASVIAEGIETPEQLRVVRELDIAAGQGYLLGRPGKAEDLATIAMTAVDLDALLGNEDWLGAHARVGGHGFTAPFTAG